MKKKAQAKRKATGDNRWRAASELKEGKGVLRTIGHSLLRPIQLLVFEPMCLNLCIFSAIILGILYLFFEAFPLVFTSLYSFNQWQVGLTFLGIGIGMVIGAATTPFWHRYHIHLSERAEVKGMGEAEFQLPPAIFGALVVPIGLFWFAWTTYSSVPWIVPVLGASVFGLG